jgi:hypothetical protein
MSTRVDEAVDSAASKLDDFVRRARTEGGAKAKIAEQFEGDPEFLRKLKPSLVTARLRGQAGRPEEPPEPATQSDGGAPKAPKQSGGGPNPFVVIGAAFLVGVLVAKVIDWRSHAHPRA